MPYQASIKNIASNLWLKSERNGHITMTDQEDDRLLFYTPYGKDGAEETLARLEDRPEPFALIREDDQQAAFDGVDALIKRLEKDTSFSHTQVLDLIEARIIDLGK